MSFLVRTAAYCSQQSGRAAAADDDDYDDDDNPDSLPFSHIRFVKATPKTLT